MNQARIPAEAEAFRATAEHNGISLRLIGHWYSSTGYYAGSDGNAWAYDVATRKFSNEGELNRFRGRFPITHRGELFDFA